MLQIWQIVLIIVIVLAGYPAGLLIAKLASDELRTARKYFELILLFCFVAIILSFIFVKGEVLLFLSAIFIFIILLTLPSLIKSKTI